MEFLVLIAVIGLIPAAIAHSKGHSFFMWWIYGAALFIVALPHSLLLKPDTKEIENRELASSDAKKCPFCAEVIKVAAVRCPRCQADLSGNTGTGRSAEAPRQTTAGPASTDKPFYCGRCGVLLPAGSKYCNECGAKVVRALEAQQ